MFKTKPVVVALLAFALLASACSANGDRSGDGGDGGFV